MIEGSTCCSGKGNGFGPPLAVPFELARRGVTMDEWTRYANRFNHEVLAQNYSTMCQVTCCISFCWMGGYQCMMAPFQNAVKRWMYDFNNEVRVTAQWSCPKRAI